MTARALALPALLLGSACATAPGLDALQHSYVIGFLARNPVVNTYLGGVGLDPSLSEVDGLLRDHSAEALIAEDRWLEEIDRHLAGIDPSTIGARQRIDREVARAQIAFLLHQHRERRWQERCVDTYVDEPFRGVDWQIQGMTPTGAERVGTEAEWRRVAARVAAVPRYLERAMAQLSTGVLRGNLPDRRVVLHDGIETTPESAKYFAEELPRLAGANLDATKDAALLGELARAGQAAAQAYRGFGAFLERTYFVPGSDPNEARVPIPALASDRFAIGEAEYDWALAHNLRIPVPARTLYEEAWPIVERTRGEIATLARQIAGARGLVLPDDDAEAVRRVDQLLQEDHPKSDEEMFAWYREAAVRLVDFARRTGLFEVPATYQLDVVETPAPLRGGGGGGAAYYPAPPFKGTGVGRFYLSPTDNDPSELARVARASVADLAVHEGFPGHDWNYKVMTQYAAEISPVRWLTPGAVEDSSSMWQDSLASEGWALYAESLMSEPNPAAPDGFYTPEERFYVLWGRLYRELRVRLDTGLHLGILSFDDAVDLFSEVMDGYAGSCRDPKRLEDPKKRASCKSAGYDIARYAKWPTQAVAYRLGADALRSLRARAQEQLGPRFDLRAFHLAFMRQGSIPPGLFGDELLRELAGSAASLTRPQPSATPDR